MHSFPEMFVDLALVGFDVILTRVKALGQVVSGGVGFAGFGAGAGGVLRVLAVCAGLINMEKIQLLLGALVLGIDGRWNWV